jgi:hypothetical protein
LLIFSQKKESEFLRKTTGFYSTCKKLGSLVVEKNMGMKIGKEWVNCEVTFYGENRKQQLTSLRKKSLITKKAHAIKPH